MRHTIIVSLIIAAACAHAPRRAPNQTAHPMRNYNDAPIRACSGRVTISIAPSARDAWKEVGRAVGYWNRLGFGDLFTPVARAGQIIVVRAEGWSPHLAVTQALSSEIGCISSGTITLYDTRDKSSVELESIIRHELGHVLGLAHTDSPGPDDDLDWPPLMTTRMPMDGPDHGMLHPLEATRAELDLLRMYYPVIEGESVIYVDYVPRWPGIRN